MTTSCHPLTVTFRGITLRAFETLEDADVCSPTLRAGPLRVLDLPGSIDGCKLVFWLGDLSPEDPIVAAEIQAFCLDRDVVALRYVRGHPRR